jgi:hypothetical protein
MTDIQARNAKFEALFAAGKINVRKVRCLGSFVHIDAFNNCADKISEMMGLAGFRLLSASDGVHMDGVDGFRMVFQVK